MRTPGTPAVVEALGASGVGDDLFRNLIEAAPDAVVVADAAGHIVLVNSQTEKLFQYSRDKLLGQPIELLIPERFAPRHRQHRERYSQAPKARAMGAGLELFARRCDGSEFPVEISLSPLRVGDDLLVTAAVRDISQRKRQERLLLENQTRLKLLHAVAAAATAGATVDQVVHTAVRALAEAFPAVRVAYSTIDQAEQLRVLAAQEPPGMSALEGLTADLSIAPDYLAELRKGLPLAVADVAADARFAPLGEALRAGSTRACLDVPVGHSAALLGLLCFDAPAVHHWTEHEISTLSAVGQQLSVALSDAQARDALETSRRELKDKELRLAEAQQIAHMGSWDWDIPSNQVTWSDELYRIYGLDPASFTPTYDTFLERLHPHDRLLADQVIRRAYQTLQPFEYDHRILRPDGSVRVLHAQGRVLTDGQGVPVRMYGTGQDITEMKQAQSELAARAEALARSNEELEQFAYVASHDLQEPLRTVASYTQLLLRRYRKQLDAQADEYIDFIVEAVQRMHGLIHDLLAYSRVGRKDADVASVNLAAALDSVLANLQGAIAETGARITHDALPTVSGDRAQLVQILQNLIGNALKFQEAGRTPEIHIGARRQGQAWAISVRDNGIGIDPSYFSKLFLIFQRLHTRESYPGSGVGLAICKKIIARRGGRIWVESEPGKGSTFYFTLPDRPSA